MEDSNKQVHGFWFGKELSLMEILCVASFQNNGHIFNLWTYGDVSVPNTINGRKVPRCAYPVFRDASKVLPEKSMFTTGFGDTQGRKNYIAHWSDLFSLKVIEKEGGWWVDMDIACIKPLDFKEDFVFMTIAAFKGKAGGQIYSDIYNSLSREINADTPPTYWHQSIQHINQRISDLGVDNIHKRWAITGPVQDSVAYFSEPGKYPPKEQYLAHWCNRYTTHNNTTIKNTPVPGSFYSLMVKKHLPELLDSNKYKVNSMKLKIIKIFISDPPGKKVLRVLNNFLCRLFSKKVILILGCQRSGNTLLYMMMTSHQNITGKDETESEYLFPNAKDILINILKGKYTCFKLPTKIPELNVIREKFPFSTILWVKRDPLSVISSMKKLIMKDSGKNWLQTYGPRELDSLTRLFPEIKTIINSTADQVEIGAYVWKYSEQAFEKYKESELNICTVRFEELLKKPQQTLTTVLDGLGLKWDIAMLSHEKVHKNKKYAGGAMGNRPLDGSRALPEQSLTNREIGLVDDILKKDL